MDEKIFIEKYEAEKVFLKEWGNIINNKILKALEEKNINKDLFLKIPSLVRIKDNNSIINKAFYRNKGYDNPLEKITDKVGLRYVVLLESEISIVKKIIEDEKMWEYSKDKDFESIRLENPTLFDYQSVHYIIRNRKEIISNGCTIPEKTPCEIQIRTLLQHAYSELSHDTIYKPKKSAEPFAKRLVARSMAMIETTDTIFEEVNKFMKNNNLINSLLPIIDSEYAKIAQSENNNKLVTIITEAYEEEINNLDLEDFKRFLVNKSNLLTKQIRRKYNNYLLFRQPIVIFLFYLVDKKASATKSKWPLTLDTLQPIFISLGLSFDM